MSNPFFKNKGPFKINDLLELSNIDNKENFNKSKAIIEAFKKSNIKKILNNKLEMKNNYDRIIKYRQFY